MPNIFQRVGGAFKAALKSWSFSSGNGRGGYQGSIAWPWWSTSSADSINYAGEVGDIWRNNSVFTVINWLRRNFPEAPVGVSAIGEDEVDHQHAFAQIVRQPNPYYSRTTLWAATVLSYIADGNAYWFKRRNAIGEVVEYWYRPHWLVRPVRGSGAADFIGYYEYFQDKRWQRIEKSEVVHLRNGIDPDNEMRGLSDLAYLLKTVFTDNESNTFCAAMLMNMGMPGVIFRHGTTGTADPLETAEAEHIKAKYEAYTTNENRGRAFVLDGDWQVDWPKFEMDAAFVEKVKNLSQADICAAIGLPAVVVGFLVGLQTATAKASHEDARRQAYTECLIPMQKSIAEDLTQDALRDFDADPMKEVAFDYEKVSALGEASNVKAERFERLARGAAELIKAGFEPAAVLQAAELPEMAFKEPEPAPMQPAGNPVQVAPGQEEANGNGNGAASTNGNGRNGAG